MRPDDHRACELRHRELLDRLHDVSERLERLEGDQRTFLEILRDFRELVRLMTIRVRALHQRIDQLGAMRMRLAGHRERIARHLAN